jgi:hypothetical protein
MLNSKIVGALGVVAVLSSVGIGYAVTTSSVYLYGSGSAGGVSIAWVESGTGAPTTFTTGSPSNCVATFSSTSVTLTASHLSPAATGPYTGEALCDIFDQSTTGNSLNITNTGGFPVTLNDTVTCTPTCALSAHLWKTASGCWAYQDANSFGAAVLPVTLNPGGVYPGNTVSTYGWFSDIALFSSGTGCSGSSFSVTVTFTGTGT